MPLTASVLCVAAVVVPLWFVLPERWTFQASALYGSLALPGDVILVGLCLLLALFGWIEEDNALESIRVPETLRVDRLPEPEG